MTRTDLNSLADIFVGKDPRVPYIVFFLLEQNKSELVKDADQLSKALEHEDPIVRLNPEQAVKLQGELQAALSALTMM